MLAMHCASLDVLLSLSLKRTPKQCHADASTLSSSLLTMYTYLLISSLYFYLTNVIWQLYHDSNAANLGTTSNLQMTACQLQ